jgi:hypothetical protein
MSAPSRGNDTQTAAKGLTAVRWGEFGESFLILGAIRATILLEESRE